MVTLAECYRHARAQLARLGVDDPSHEALLLCERFLGVSDRARLLTEGDRFPSEEDVRALWDALERRACTPLQYILGRWEFDGMALRVEPGVLVPRQDTLALVDLADEFVPQNAFIADLCAGSGAVGLALARRHEDVRCVCVELSPEALPVLRENVAMFGRGRVDVMCADVLAGPPCDLSGVDMICANPPYIPTADIAALTGDVIYEPTLALDGGADGLVFYRAILERWLPVLRPGGAVAFEFGIGQAQALCELMTAAGLTDISQRKDYGGIDRAIIGTLPA